MSGEAACKQQKKRAKFGVSAGRVLLGDGLAVLQDKPVVILSVCGMGAETICAMLRDGREWLAGLNYMVLQPMSRRKCCAVFACGRLWDIQGMYCKRRPQLLSDHLRHRA
jgi:tRNA A22 N-methylase